MKQSLSLRVSQHLALTPQLQQSIRLLQLSTLELNQEVEQMLDENPFLEVSDDSAGPAEASGSADAPTDSASADRHDSQESSATEGGDGSEDDSPAEADSISDWEGDGSVDPADDGDWSGETGARNGGGDDEVSASDLARSHESLQDHLHRQALGLRLDETGRQALYFLIESLNDDGYLEDPLDELALSLTGPDPDPEQFEELVEQFRIALKLLQSLEPVGVGARDLAECLQLQLAQLPASDARSVAQRLCRQPMDLLARRDIKKLVQLCEASDAQVRAAIGLIGRLEPKPGRRFANVERNIIVPDVLVTSSGSGPTIKFRAQLNPDVMPRLRVHDVYANALKGYKGDGSLQQRLQEARWFIKNIQQRFDTILRVSSAIVERQRNFFIHGELAMRPLVLREIADELGLHESTISRVTTAKYIATPYGTFELKYFFGSALGTETGGNASSTAVRALIKQFVASESPKKPLSDNQLSEMLREQGIECARRTVAKYREALRIAPANLRRAL
ncbi:MAG: RNA polymerase factor sigma-54 [Comamonas sp.]